MHSSERGPGLERDLRKELAGTLHTERSPDGKCAEGDATCYEDGLTESSAARYLKEDL